MEFWNTQNSNNISIQSRRLIRIMRNKKKKNESLNIVFSLTVCPYNGLQRYGIFNC